MSRIEYRPPAAAGVEILSMRGTMPGNRFNTLSSNPFVVAPAGTFGNGVFFIPICLSAFINWGGVNRLLSPIQLTFDIAVQPMIELDADVPGGGLVTSSLMPYLNGGLTQFQINNINTGAIVTNLVFKSIADSPLADYFEMPYEILYILSYQLV
jgi:hypothetical protein